MRNYFILIITLFLFCVVACTPQEPIVLPTFVPTSTPPPTAAATQETAPTQPSGPPTERSLPPTWTPTFTPTVTFAPPTERPTLTEPPPATLLDVCSTFAVDVAQSARDFPANAEPQVFWTPVEGASQYRVTLLSFDEFGNPTFEFDGYTSETSYTFTIDLFLFEAGRPYGWEVYPIDNRGIQMCISRGGELLPFIP